MPDATPSRHRVILVPGFFAFAELGDLAYFRGVGAELSKQLQQRGVPADVVEVRTLPTASIRHRAAKVLDVIHDALDEGAGAVHLVGHSTGGLDARLAVAPTASLPSRRNRQDAYERIKSLVTVSAPHFGTPLAAYYGSAMGKPLLQLLALATASILRYGKLPVDLLIKLGGLFARADDYVGLDDNVLDQVYADLLDNFTADRRDAVVRFLHDVRSDQSLIFQLTPAALDLFNATSADPSFLRYGSVVTRAAPPRLTGVWSHGANPYAQSMYVIYLALWWVASRSNPQWLASLDESQEASLAEAYAAVPSPRDSDGVVPTLSQVWGPVVHATHGDHLDVIGHFGAHPDAEGVQADWLPSASGFDPNAFSALWSDVAEFIAGA